MHARRHHASLLGRREPRWRVLCAVAGALVTLAQGARADTLFTALLKGQQVNPPTGSTTLGWALIVLNDAQNRLSIDFFQVSCSPPCLGEPITPAIDYTGNLTPNPDDDVTGFHIHRGAAGVNGPEVFGFINPNSDLNGDLVVGPGTYLASAWDSNEGIGTTLGAELANLFAENLYIDLHTSGFPDGEIRGQIINPVPEPKTALLVAVGLLAIAASARRSEGTASSTRVAVFDFRRLRRPRFLPSFCVVCLVAAAKSAGAQVPPDSPDVPIINTANFTQSENSVFIHPLDPELALVSNNSFTYPGNPGYVRQGADSFVSTDGGANWQGDTGGAGGTNRGDPAVAINRLGRLFVGYIAENDGQGVAYSDDLGASFTHVQVAPDPSPGTNCKADKNHLWIDNNPDTASPYHGNLYSAWTNFVDCEPPQVDGFIFFSRSTDAGFNWSPGVNISLGWHRT